MFIKWRETNRPLTSEREEEIAHLRPAWASSKREPSCHRLYAYLAESRRVEGKPRQKIISYLGSIPAMYAQDDSRDEWREFWYKVFCSLCLVSVNYRLYHHVMGEIEKRVMRPSNETLGNIVIEGFECHPHWHKDYEALRKALQRGQFYFE